MWPGTSAAVMLPLVCAGPVAGLLLVCFGAAAEAGETFCLWDSEAEGEATVAGWMDLAEAAGGGAL